MKELNKKQKTIKEIRKNFISLYNKYVEEFNEVNNKLVQLAKDVDEILSFMDTTIEARKVIE